MRKNSVRKFIHAVLDCLPLLIIPIFAIYSMNHEINGYSVNTSGYEVRNKYETNEVNNYNDLYDDNIYKISNDDRFYQFVGDVNPYVSYFYYIDEQFSTKFEGTNEDINLWLNTNSNYIEISNDDDYPYIRVDADYIYLVCIWSDYSSDLENYLITIEQSDYIPKEYVWNEGIVLDDEDIGSQLVYCLYNTTDKYFNMNKVFNLGNIWTWVQNNMFGGQAPLSAYIVYNIIAYEFIMDVIFLLYSVFMFIIDFAEKCLDRFMGRANKC